MHKFRIKFVENRQARQQSGALDSAPIRLLFRSFLFYTDTRFLPAKLKMKMLRHLISIHPKQPTSRLDGIGDLGKVGGLLLLLQSLLTGLEGGQLATDGTGLPRRKREYCVSSSYNNFIHSRR